MPAVQMNLRLDSRVKEQGDAVLMQAGYSPTQAVRTLWTFAAAHTHEPHVVRNLLQQAESERDSDREMRVAKKKAALRHVDDLRKQLETFAAPSQSGDIEHRSFKDLRDEALFERWEEKGLLS